MITVTPNEDIKYFKTSLNFNDIIFDIEINCQNELLTIRINKQNTILKNIYEKTFSKQELDDSNKYFLLFDNILEIFNKFVDLLKSNFFEGEIKNEEIILKVKTILIDFSLNIPMKENFEMNEFMKQLNEQNIELKRKIKELEENKAKKEIEIKPNRKNKKNIIKKKIFIFLLIIYFYIQIIILSKINQIIEKNKFQTENFQNTLKNIKQQIEEINDNSFYSSILLNKEEKNLISNWINQNTKIKYKLLFRASDDGDSIETFHKKCDNIGPTLILIKSKKGKRFGGYNPLNWDSTYMYKHHPSTFLFSLDNKKKYKLKEDNVQYSSVGGKSYFAFGIGHDLYISDHCTRNSNSYSNPYSFMINDFYELTDEKYFSISDYEVYSVNFEN